MPLGQSSIFKHPPGAREGEIEDQNQYEELHSQYEELHSQYEELHMRCCTNVWKYKGELETPMDKHNQNTE